MDIVNSTISNVVNIGLPQGAAEARRDSMARETIPQLNQNAASSQNQGAAQNTAANVPTSSNLFIQTDSILKVSQEKNFSQKGTIKNKKEEKTTEAKAEKAKEQGGASGASSSLSSKSLSSKVASIDEIRATLSGAFGKSGVDYSLDADQKREKGNGYKSKTIASKYGSCAQRSVYGNFIDTTS